MWSGGTKFYVFGLRVLCDEDELKNSRYHLYYITGFFIDVLISLISNSQVQSDPMPSQIQRGQGKVSLLLPKEKKVRYS